MSLTTVAEYALMLTGSSPPQPQSPALANLTVRERELLVLVAQGHTNAEIAALLHLSTSTVSFRLNRIRAKTGSHRRADLTRFALQAGLL